MDGTPRLTTVVPLASSLRLGIYGNSGGIPGKSRAGGRPMLAASHELCFEVGDKEHFASLKAACAERGGGRFAAEDASPRFPRLGEIAALPPAAASVAKQQRRSRKRDAVEGGDAEETAGAASTEEDEE